MQPLVRNFLIDENGMDDFKRDLNKKFEQRATYQFYEPSNDVREMRMEKVWEKNRNADLAEKRQNEEMVQMLTDWSHSKSRLQKEIARKIDSGVHGSAYADIKYMKKHYSANQMKTFAKAAQLRKDEFGNIVNEDEEYDEDEQEEERQQKKQQHRKKKDNNANNTDQDYQEEDDDGNENQDEEQDRLQKKRQTQNEEEENKDNAEADEEMEGRQQSKGKQSQNRQKNNNRRGKSANNKKNTDEQDEFDKLIPEDNNYDGNEEIEEDQINPIEHEEAFDLVPAPGMPKNRP